MCIIFYNEKGSPYNLNEIRNGWTNNPDGLGLMWVEDRKVKVIRGLYDKESAVELARDFAGIPHVLHLRFGTHGSVCEELTHPFRVTPNGAKQHVWMMHNGVIADEDLAEKPGKNESDTQVFARQLQHKVQEHGSSDILFNEKFCRKLEYKIGSYNKVIFLRDDGKVSILHPDQWTVNKETGIWYSNQYSIISPRWSAKAEMAELAALELEVFTYSGVDDSDVAEVSAQPEPENLDNLDETDFEFSIEASAEEWEELFGSNEYIEYATKHGITS